MWEKQHITMANILCGIYLNEIQLSKKKKK